MTARRPLVLVSGSAGELPSGDTLVGAADTAGRTNRCPFPVPRVGDWLAQHALSVATHTPSNGAAMVGPLWLPAGTYDAVAFQVTSAGSTGAAVKVVAYADDTGRPGSLVLDTDTAVATSTGQKTITGLSLVIPDGGQLLHASTVTQGSPATAPSLYRVSGSAQPLVWASSPDLSYSPSLTFVMTGVTGSAPSTFTVNSRSDGHTRLAFRRSA